MKLKNQYIEAGRLESEGKDLGDLAVALVSDMTKGDVEIGPMTAMEHLRRGVYVQKSSYLQEHQWLSAGDAKDVIENPKEKYYTWVVAELNGKGVGFAAVDKSKFTDESGQKGESFVKMFYVPTIVTQGDKDFSNSNVIKGNGQKEPLEQLILRLSLDQVGGRNLLSVFDGPDAELPSLAAKGYTALTPKFDIPSVGAKTSREFSQVADQVYMVIKLPEGAQEAQQYQFGVELDKAFQLYNSHLRESYIDEFANVRGSREFQNKRILTAMGMYNGGITKLVESAVKVGDKIIVPYKDMQISGAAPLNPKEKEQLTQHYLELGKEAIKQYKRHFPEGK